MYCLIILPHERKIFQSLIFFAGDNLYTDVSECPDPKYIDICNQSAIKLFKSVLKTVTILIVCAIIYALFPIHAFIVKNEIQLPVPILFPFTDLESTNGLTINMFNQIFLLFYGCVGTFGFEIFNCILKNAVWMAMMGICHSVDELSMNLQEPTPQSICFIKCSYRNIIIQIQDYDR